MSVFVTDISVFTVWNAIPSVIHPFLYSGFRGSLNAFTWFSELSLPFQFGAQYLRTIFGKESKLNFIYTASK